ncbi:tetratricopeptide repeat protein, partial [Candidatus Saccharibacteria bacterium]|nr:tetratricopeptide repeat protein [Candidatus Saccharibacteria bacterium]NIW78358.1 tetratricopeptide repeat protein [Calditrichia bacterium]
MIDSRFAATEDNNIRPEKLKRTKTALMGLLIPLLIETGLGQGVRRVDNIGEQYNHAPTVSELLLLWKENPSNLEIVQLLAKAYKKMGKFSRALYLYEKILSKRPSHKAARRAAAQLYIKKGQFRKAATYYFIILDYNPKDIAALWGVSDICMQTGQTEKAEFYLKTALKYA